MSRCLLACSAWAFLSWPDGFRRDEPRDAGQNQPDLSPLKLLGTLWQKSSPHYSDCSPAAECCFFSRNLFILRLFILVFGRDAAAEVNSDLEEHPHGHGQQDL